MLSIIGCSVPLLIYFIWELIILGMFNKENVIALDASGNGEFIVHFLQRTIASPHLFLFIQLFSFFALFTSLITVGLSFHDFIKDRLRSSLNFRNSILPLLIVVPPFALSIFTPNLFIKGLSLAGGLGAVLLFGLIPCIMCWNVRYKNSIHSELILGGGKTTLIALMIASGGIFFD